MLANIQQEPFISIITPVFNGAKYISKCLDSVHTQTYKNHEHIVLDALSSDGTDVILNDYCNVNSKLQVFRERDEGVYDAMNKGIKLAKGSWIIFLGADDYFINEFVLEKFYAQALLYPGALYHYGDVFHEGLNRTYDGRFTVKKILSHNICHQGIFYHKSLFRSKGLFSNKYKIEADYALNIKIFMDGKIQVNYLPFLISYFSAGGKSSMQRDEKFKNDFPSFVLNAIVKGNLILPEKLYLVIILCMKLSYRFFIKNVIKVKTFFAGMKN